MLFSARKTLEDRIIEKAIGGTISIKSLHAVLTTEEAGLSLRAVYKAAEKLIEGGALLKVGKKVFLSEEWASGVREKLAPHRAPPSLSKGERAVYTFVSMEHLDAFWTTIAIQLEESGSTESFFYNPHNFWAYIPERKEYEDKYYAHFAETGRYGFLTVGGESVADKEFKREYQNEHFQVDTRSIPAFKRTDHVSIMGDFIITVRLPKKMAGEIDGLYASDKPMSEMGEALEKTYRKPMTTRFVLENNPMKAKKFRKMLSLNFYFKPTA